MNQEAYEYHNCPIPGGGYVTGFLYHPTEKGLLYLRTDIGGAYRFDATTERWISLVDCVTTEDLKETFPIALAVSAEHPEKLYMMSGIYQQAHGLFSVSDDQGEHFRQLEVPFMVHGNLNGRGVGYRLITLPGRPGHLLYASQENGLWRTEDEGETWTRVRSMPENFLTFVATLPEGGIVVGSAGVTTKRSEHLRGWGLYVSYDGGVSFTPLTQPLDYEVDGIRLGGLVPQRYAIDNRYLYVTFSIMGYNAYALEHGYSCDGGSVVGGRLVRYALLPGGRLGTSEEISPRVVTALVGSDRVRSEKDLTSLADANHLAPYGFGGVCCNAAVPGLLVVSTLSKGDGDSIYRSYDYGETWECILHDLEIGRMDFRTNYMKPECNGGANIIHWLSDVKIDPADPDTLWFNTGTGVYRTRNLRGDVVVFEDWCDGLEETVHLNLYSPVGGDVKLIDILGDLGGFAFTDPGKPCDNSFADADGNRYITCLNADISDTNPALVLVTPRGNWKGKTKGGLILSRDGGKTFERLPMPWGISEKLDDLLHAIERPNVNSGWCALSPCGQHIVWTVGDGNELPIDCVIASHDGGNSFTRSSVHHIDGTPVEATPGRHFKVFSDRLRDDLFYGFDERGHFYVSTDSGDSFYEQRLDTPLPEMELGLVDCANKSEIRGEAGRSGVFYLALREHGLWKLTCNATTGATHTAMLSAPGDIVYRMGLGLSTPYGNYCMDPKAIYIAANIEGEYGFYRFLEADGSYTRLNTDRQMFGEINSIEGDSQVYGRFYIGTGTRGVLYGQPL